MTVTTEHFYTGNNSTTSYAYTFPYYKTSDIKVALDNVIKTESTHYNVSGTNIVFTSGNTPGTGVEVHIYRETDVDTSKATFAAGSSIRATDLNNNNTQLLYAAQEEQGQGIDTTKFNDGVVTSAKIADNAITTAKIAADAVTGAKIADDAIDSEHLAADSIDAEHYAAGSVDATALATNAVTTVKITDANVTEAKIASNAITGAKIADDQINSEHYVDGSIDTAHIADSQITAAKLASDAVTTAKITDANITTAKIANDAVTADKLAHTAVTAGSYTTADITVDAQGRITAAASGSVGTSEIANDAITSAKIADDSIDSEHYVDASIDTAHIGDAQITTAKIANSNITTAKIANDAVDSDKIATNAVGSSEISTGAVTDAKLASDAVTTVKILDSNVTTAKIAADAITGAKIADDAIDSEHYTDGSIDTAHIADSQVTTAKIADDAITAAKVADDIINSEHYAAASIDTEHIADGQVTAVKVASNAVTTSKITDANVTTDKIADDAITIGKIGCEQTTISDSDSHVPTSGAVVDYVSTQLAAVGGFETIATDAAFPNTQVGSGIIVSIADAGGLVVNGSGTSTTGRTVGGSTVTINNINSQFNSTTVADGVAFMVESTGSGQIYNYHKATLKEADLINLSSDIDDFGNRYRVNAGEPSDSLHEGDLVYDTTADKMKVYDSSTSAWKEVTSTGDFKYLVMTNPGTTNAATLNGSNVSFDLKETSTSGSAASVTSAAQLLVSVNGVVQKANTGTSTSGLDGFVLTDADTIKFCAGIPSGADVFIVQFGSALTITTPGDGTVATAKLANGAVTTDKLADANVTDAKLASNAVTTGKINADAVTGAKIADDAIDSEHYTDASIDHAHLANDAVDGDNIADDSINSEHYVDGSIDTAHIADSQVTNAKLADNAVNTAKIADNVVNEVKLNIGNSPTDGQYLQANAGSAGGMRWADASAGKLLQVQNTTLTAHTSQTISNSFTYEDITNFNCAITPASASNKIMITMHIMGEGTIDDNRWMLRIKRAISGGATTYIQGAASGNRSQMIGQFGSHYHADDNTDTPATFEISNYLDSPSTTSAVTYTLQIAVRDSGGKDWHTNRCVMSDDIAGSSVGVSWITLQEISG